MRIPWRRRARRRRRAALVAIPLGALGLAGAVGGVLVRRARARRRGETYRCECGQRFRVAGRERHRIYWLPDAPDSDPVLGETCPSCGRALPQSSERVTVGPVVTPV